MNVNSRNYIAQFFPDVSGAAIQKIDDEWMIIGKYSRVTPMKPGTWDLWICDGRDPDKGLGQRKVSFIASELRKHPLICTLKILDGEAYTTLQGIQVISQNLNLLGIRRRRTLLPTEDK